MSAETGYRFYPSRYNPPVGHAKLDVYLTPAPTERVFDCAGFYLRILESGHDVPTTISITHNAEIADRRYRVALGRFWLYDFSGHALEGFSFGGHLALVRQDDHTMCQFESTAPILELDPDNYDIERVFVDAVEALAGVLRADWRDDGDAEWLANLATVEPFPLFVSCLVSVQDYLNNGSHDDELVRLRAWIKRTIHSLQDAGEWPEQKPTLVELEQSLNQVRKPPGHPGAGSPTP